MPAPLPSPKAGNLVSAFSLRSDSTTPKEKPATYSMVGFTTGSPGPLGDHSSGWPERASDLCPHRDRAGRPDGRLWGRPQPDNQLTRCRAPPAEKRAFYTCAYRRRFVKKSRNCDPILQTGRRVVNFAPQGSDGAPLEQGTPRRRGQEQGIAECLGRGTDTVERRDEGGGTAPKRGDSGNWQAG